MIFTYIYYDLQSVLSNADELYGSSNSVGMDSTDAGKYSYNQNLNFAVREDQKIRLRMGYFRLKRKKARV